MIEKTIKYENFAGDKCESTFQFHLFEHDLRELELGMDEQGGLSRYLQKIAGENDSRKLYEMFRTLVLKSYGELTPDNGSFIKRRNGVALAEAFEQTAAYDALLTSFFDNADELVDFIIGIMPKDLQAAARKAVDESKIEVLKS